MHLLHKFAYRIRLRGEVFSLVGLELLGSRLGTSYLGGCEYHPLRSGCDMCVDDVGTYDLNCSKFKLS
jgi:hypothetical protein